MRYISTFVVFIVLSCPVLADDKVALEQLLTEFLSGQTEQHHADFWADELIYTSSSGSRFGKAEIMAGFKSRDAAAEQPSETTYSGEDIDIRLYDDIAIVAFVLIAKEEGKVIQTYFNTGTFKKKLAQWQAIAWQATKIPQDQVTTK